MQNCGEEWMRNDRHSHPGRVGGGGTEQKFWWGCATGPPET